MFHATLTPHNWAPDQNAVCDDAHESCPIFPGTTRVVHRGFDDPLRLAATAPSEAEALGFYRRVRDEVRVFVSDREYAEVVSRQSHWNRIYSTRPAEELSWFQRHPAVSLELIELANVGPSAAVLDIGGGDSLLVDRLLELGYEDLTVLDVSSAALERARRRLGNKAASVDWVARDVTRWEPERAYDLWHDRAVFHFLTEAADRQRYIEVLERTLRPGGRAILATFSLEGPPKCSGLDVQRYSVETLAEELGRSFRLEEGREQRHQTPAGKSQAFVYTLFRRAV